MTDDKSRVAWADVEDTAQATDYLDTVTGLDAIEAYKRRSHRLLNLGSGDRVIDVGCGTGEDVLSLADHVGADGEVMGIDRSPTLIAEARTRCAETDRATFLIGDALRLGFGTDAVDGCRTDRVLQHLPEPARAIAEMCRVTRPGGRVTLSEPDWRTFTLSVPSVDEALTEAVTDERWSGVRRPAIGSSLYVYAREAGLTDLEINATTIAITDFDTANQVLQFDERLDTMQATDVVRSDRAQQWRDGVRRADAVGTFFSSMTGFTVAGTVPTT